MPNAGDTAQSGMNAPSKPQIDRLLGFVAVFERPGYSFGEWHSPAGQLPYFAYSQDVQCFIQVLYDEGWIEEFDWPNWQARARELYRDPAALAQARLPSLRRLLTTHVRKDRFCEGHFAGMLQEGHILAILRRIEELRPT